MPCYLSRDLLIVTNAHVIEDAHDAEVKLVTGNSFRVQSVLALDGKNDLAILQVSIPPAARVTPLPVVGATPSEGVKVFVVGQPAGLEWTFSDGIVSAVRQINEGVTVIQMTAPISPGSSGGPVFNMRGEVLGVAVSQLIGKQNLNFAVPGKEVLSLRLSPSVTLAALAREVERGRAEKADRLFSEALRASDAVYAAAHNFDDETRKEAARVSIPLLYGSHTKKWISDPSKMMAAEKFVLNGVAACWVKKITRKPVGDTKTDGRSYLNGSVTML